MRFSLFLSPSQRYLVKSEGDTVYDSMQSILIIANKVIRINYCALIREHAMTANFSDLVYLLQQLNVVVGRKVKQCTYWAQTLCACNCQAVF